MRWLLSILVCFFLMGCKRQPTLPPPLPSDIPEIDQADFTLLTPLTPNRQTHLTVDPASNVYFTQEMSDGSDVVFVMGSGDEAIATRLTSANILDAMHTRGIGNIESIAATEDGAIDFFFAGGTNKSSFACFGRFDRRTNAIRILADTQQLADATGMGASLALARGSVASSGGIVWLLIHHTDNAVLYALQPSDLPPNGPAQLDNPLKLDTLEDPPRLTSDDVQLSPGNQQSVLLIDSPTTALWQIDSTGKARVLQSTVGLPIGLSQPGQGSRGDASGAIVMFAPSAKLIEAKVPQRVDPVRLSVHFPAVLILRQDKLIAIDRDDLHLSADYPLYAMQLQQVVYERGRDTWLGYDSAAGQLVRFHIKSKG